MPYNDIIYAHHDSVIAMIIARKLAIIQSISGDAETELDRCEYAVKMDWLKAISNLYQGHSISRLECELSTFIN